MPMTNVLSCRVDGAYIVGSHLLTQTSSPPPANLFLRPGPFGSFHWKPQWITSPDIYMHKQGRAAWSVSLACSRRLLFRLLFVSEAPLGASPERPSRNHAIASVSPATNAALSTWHIRNMRLTTQRYEARAFYLTPQHLRRGMNVRDNTFKTKKVPSEWDRRESIGRFLINKTTE